MAEAKSDEYKPLKRQPEEVSIYYPSFVSFLTSSLIIIIHDDMLKGCRRSECKRRPKKSPTGRDRRRATHIVRESHIQTISGASVNIVLYMLFMAWWVNTLIFIYLFF